MSTPLVARRGVHGGSARRRLRGPWAPRWTLAAVLAVSMLCAASCSIVGGGGGSYELVAYFPRAVALYEKSDVRVLGLPAGHVTKVEAEGDRVRVTMAIDDGVPVPLDDLRAVIVPQSLIGERYVQLSPVWTEGQRQAPSGHVIDQAHTIVPTEPDETLAALKEFLDSLDPDGLGRLVGNAAGALEGQGEDLGSALRQVSSLVQTFAAKDDELLGIIDHFDRFTGTLATRESQLGEILTTFSQATQVLADERAALDTFLGGLASLSTNGLRLVATHDQSLRRDLEVLTDTTRSIRANLDALEALLDSAPLLAEGLAGAYNEDLRAMNLRTQFEPLVSNLLNDVLSALPEFGGLRPLVCIPIGVECRTTGSTTTAGRGTGASLDVAPAPAQLSRSVNPVDTWWALLRTPMVPGPIEPSVADQMADLVSGIGGLAADGAASLVGGHR